MPAPQLHHFTVEGRGEFPFDMLRYDNCWPYGGDDAAKLAHHVRERRVVQLVSHDRTAPTTDRWSSFLWTVTKKEVRHISDY